MITGSIVALVTPMHIGSDAVDWDSLSSLIEWHILEGTDAIVAVGTTGESATLNVQEHASVIEFIVSKVNKRIPVIAGTGANSTAEAIELTAMAMNVGADASLLVTPYYNKPSQEGLFAHFSAIAECTEKPIILYSIPSRCGIEISTSTIERGRSAWEAVGGEGEGRGRLLEHVGRAASRLGARHVGECVHQLDEPQRERLEGGWV